MLPEFVFLQLPLALGRMLTLEQIFIGWNGTE